MKIRLSYFVALLVLFLCSINGALAQDKIYKKSKSKPVLAKVVEIGTGEIKYKLWGEQADELVYVIEKEFIIKIEFENGRTEYYGKEKMDAEEYFQGQKKRALKVSFLGPLSGFTSFTYEQNIRPGRSWEIKGSIVGLGIDREFDDNASGFIGSVAYKLYRKPTFVTSDLRRRHILQGAYLKPEFFFGPISRDVNFIGAGSDRRETDMIAGFMLNLGKQWVFGDVMPFDISFGLGYGSGESVRPYFVVEGFAFSTGLHVGIAF
ncbi:MAG: hypothetical protein AAF573_09960 [Bacteroidota bacterium]